MNAIETLIKRRSVRVFNDRDLSKKDLELIAEAGRFAPTARNVQPWKFIIVTEKKTLERVGKLAENGSFISSCKACIAVFCEDTKYYLEDGCAATVNMLNAAAALGIGSCWVAGDKKPYCRDISEMLNMPEGFKLVSLIALGYPEDGNALGSANKKPLNEIIIWEKF